MNEEILGFADAVRQTMMIPAAIAKITNKMKAQTLFQDRS